MIYFKSDYSGSYTWTCQYSYDFGNTWINFEVPLATDVSLSNVYLQSSDNIVVACFSGASSDNSYTYYLDVSSSSIGTWQQVDTISGHIRKFYYWRKGLILASFLLCG